MDNVRVKMLHSAEVPGYGHCPKGRQFVVRPTEALYLINRNLAMTTDMPTRQFMDLMEGYTNMLAVQSHKDQAILRLAGTGTGPCNIIGSGPSAREFKPNGNYTIALNAAVHLVKPDLWLVVEMVARNAEWFQRAMQDTEHTRPYEIVFNTGLSNAVPDAQNRPASPFWRQVLWTDRKPYVYPLTEYHGALAVGGPQEYGGVLLNGLHLAAVMGFTEFHTWGTELCFPDGEQHFDGWNPYSEFVEYEGRVTTEFFAECAQWIKAIMAENEGLKLVDHSGGLLCG